MTAPGGRPRWVDGFILAFLAVQLAGPLEYYAARDNPFDPRFAWRMLLGTDLAHCSPVFTVDDEVVWDVESRFGTVWTGLLQHGQVENMGVQMAQRLCADNPGKSVTWRMTCKDFAGEYRVLREGDQDECSR